jgi:hypothetical protein
MAAGMPIKLPRDESGRTRKDFVGPLNSSANSMGMMAGKEEVARLGRGQARDLFNVRLSEDRAKRENEEKRQLEGMEIPEWSRDPSVRVDDTEVRQLRDGVAAEKSLRGEIDGLIAAVKKHGTTINPRNPGYPEIKARLSGLQLLMKSPSLEQLGVLAGPDMAILKSLTGDPASLEGVFRGADDAVVRLNVSKERANANLANKLGSRGYKKKTATGTRTLTNIKTGERFPGITPEQMDVLRKEPDFGDYTFEEDQ